MSDELMIANVRNPEKHPEKRYKSVKIWGQELVPKSTQLSQIYIYI